MQKVAVKDAKQLLTGKNTKHPEVKVLNYSFIKSNCNI